MSEKMRIQLLCNVGFFYTSCQGFLNFLSEASKLSGVVAHNLSGLGWLLLEVADETDRVATGYPSDAI